MLKIALSGKAKSGKNTVANMIVSKLGLKPSEYVMTAFANPIKKTIELIFPNCDKNALYGDSELRQNKIECAISKYGNLDVSFRQASIDIGKLGRAYNSDLWVWHAMEEYNLGLNQAGLKAYIVTDLRFPNERKWLEEAGFTLCRIKRSDASKIDDISETIQDDQPDLLFNHIIDNNSSIEYLEQQVTEIIDKILV